MGDRTKLIKVRVTPDQYNDITEYLDETEEWGSLSTFGQQVLVDYVRDAGDEPSGGGGEVSIDPGDIIDAVEMGLAPVNERLERLENDMMELQNTLETDSELRELADQIYDNLLEVPDGMTIDEMTPLQPDEAFLMGTPEAMAEEFGEDVGRIRRALDMAGRLYPSLAYKINRETGERRYYKEE